MQFIVRQLHCNKEAFFFFFIIYPEKESTGQGVGWGG